MVSTDESVPGVEAGVSQGVTPEETRRLEEEGEIAADYLEELLDIADLDGDIDIDVEHGRAAVEVVADDDRSLRRLVGDKGEVLDGLQELTRLAVQTRTGVRSRLMLDIAGYRARRRTELRAMAQDSVSWVRESGQACELEPLNAFERKVIHDAVAAAGLRSDSQGTDPNRFVVIYPV